MIDDYLRTSLIFYDTKDKQDWRKPVLENIRIPKAQMVERYRLPPFNIRSTTLIGVPTVFKLYCKYTDVEKADLLDPIYGGADLLNLEWDGTYYWLIYDGETKLKTAMPCGEYYVKIGDCIKTWESEVINICGVPDNVIDWLGKNTIGIIYDTQQRGDEQNILYVVGNGGGQLWYYNKKTYGCWMQRGGAGFSCENMAYAIYHKECYISESYGIGPGTAGAIDPHGWGALVIADDGHIIIAHERLTGVGDPNHNSAIEVKRSDYPENETSWINAIAYNPGYFDLVGDPLFTNPRFSYPSLDKLSNSKLFMLCRYSTAGNLDNMSVHRSDDHGVSWNAMGGPLDGGWEIVDLGLEGYHLLYKGLCSHPDDGTIYVCFNYYDSEPLGDLNYPDLYFLLSSDNGITWESVDGVLSVDITLGVAITKAQLDGGNGRVETSPAANSRLNCRSGVITNDGIPYLAILRRADGVSPYILYIYYWSGAAWVGVNTTIPINTTNPSGITILERDDCIEIIALTEESSIWKWRVYRAFKTDLTNWTIMNEIGNIYDGTTNLWSGHTFNYVDIDHETDTHSIDTHPDYWDFYLQAETDCMCCQGVAKPITIEYENTHDFAGILSEYKGRVHLCADIRNPDHKIIKSGIERDGETWIQKIITQKIYRFNILCTESLIDTLTIIPSYEIITVHFDNESAEVKEFSVAPPEWKYEGLGQLEISFIVETIIKTNCDEDYELQEELLEDGRFDHWTGIYPNRDLDFWDISEVAPAEISEVAPNEGHAAAGGVGTGACNIYSEGTYVRIYKDILTIGKTYLIKIEITKFVSGELYVILGTDGTAFKISTKGIHKLIKVCDGTDGIFTIARILACDITIDNVSVKLYS